ncbi:hypothetical protein H257_16765 [Aphanomyces astaci]|uniref:PH domain-containing protein n=1 Tax=Aphanomyces astaci TaxID=112090 RepID=W4FJF0_APHAT|nr:hypothetical protein H257_16765 [Aphanomyces astaci]ETV66969.1 hypothetical protein H257_16765 [Aphanomyces astaci]|eukprot:XP_009843610.1 hypothetical protein H257_16765 [Aphanomyces astaci]
MVAMAQGTHRHMGDDGNEEVLVVRRGLLFSSGQIEARHFGHDTTTSAHHRQHWALRYVELSTDHMLRFYTTPGGAITSSVNVNHCQNVHTAVLDTPAVSGRRLTSAWRVHVQVDSTQSIVLGALSESSMKGWATALQAQCIRPLGQTPSIKPNVPRTVAAIETIAKVWRQLFPPPSPTTSASHERRKRYHYQRTMSATR